MVVEDIVFGGGWRVGRRTREWLKAGTQRGGYCGGKNEDSSPAS